MMETNIANKTIKLYNVVGNASMTNFEKIFKIIKTNGGYITGRDIKKANISSAVLSDYVKKHNLVKQCPGFYSLEDWIKDDYFIFQYQYPKLIYSFYGAAYLNGLGDYIPTSLEVTAPKNYRPFPLPKEGVILHTDTREAIYSLGISEIETVFGKKVKVYDIEKTVCDFIRNREKIDIESFVKCMNWYKKRKDKNVNRLIRYSKIMKIESKVSNLMEILLNVE